MSDADDFFESGAFANYRKEREGNSKLALGNLNRLDSITRAIGSLGKLIAKRGSI